MSNITVTQIPVDGLDTYTGTLTSEITLRVYTPMAGRGSRPAVDLILRPDAAAEAIADLALALANHPLYGALAAAVEGFFESQAVAS